MFLFYTLSHQRCSLYPLCLNNKIRFHCDSFHKNPLFFMRKLNINTALLQKTMNTN